MVYIYIYLSISVVGTPTNHNVFPWCTFGHIPGMPAYSSPKHLTINIINVRERAKIVAAHCRFL